MNFRPRALAACLVQQDQLLRGHDANSHWGSSDERLREEVANACPHARPKMTGVARRDVGHVADQVVVCCLDLVPLFALWRDYLQFLLERLLEPTLLLSRQTRAPAWLFLLLLFFHDAVKLLLKYIST